MPIECLCSRGLGDEFKGRNRCVSYMDHKILESFEEFLIKLLRFKCALIVSSLEPLSFFLEFCHKAGNFEELIEFLGIKFEFIEGSIVFV